jgi:hypothetical protein
VPRPSRRHRVQRAPGEDDHRDQIADRQMHALMMSAGTGRLPACPSGGSNAYASAKSVQARRRFTKSRPSKRINARCRA